MMRLTLAMLLVGISLAPTGAQDSRPADRQYPSAVVYRNVMISMRDGVRLATDIYLPSEDGSTAAAGHFPVLLTRTFYNKNGLGANLQTSYTFAQHGYAVAAQDDRGRYASEGESRPWLNDGSGEHPDGYDTAVWLVKQPWCDGRLGIFGASYMGGSAIELAVMRPPGFTAAFISDPASDGYDSLPFFSGTMALSWAARWTLIYSAGEHNITADQRARWSVERERYIDPKTPTLAKEEYLKILPLRDVPVSREFAWWQEWMDNWEHPWYFAATETKDRLQNVNAPILHSAGWYSLLLPNTIAQYTGTSTRVPDASVRANQRLLVGPWGHAGCPDDGGCETFPGAAEKSNPLIDNLAYQLAWMDRWFKGKPNPVLDHPVTLYVMGENRWRAEDSWPLPGTQMMHYYLHSAGKANTAAGDGALSTKLPESESADHYSYDPKNPVPTHCSPAVSIGGMCEQSSVEARPDVLVFTTPALSEDVEVTGEWKVMLYAASSATDTDWTVKLADVHPDGTAHNVGSGVVRARYRFSRAEPQPLVPGAIESYRIDTWPTSNVFKKDHRIRIEISSSDFPWFDRNPNAYVDLTRATERDFVVAHQTIYHDAEHPSRVDLPIIPQSRARQWIATPFPGQPRIASAPANAPPSLKELPAEALLKSAGN